MAARAPIVGLTDVQLDKLLDKAHLIDPSLRTAFLNNVVDLLMPLECVTDSEVTKACDHVSRSLRHPKAKLEREQQQQVRQRA
jgi:hypothetical protein